MGSVAPGGSVVYFADRAVGWGVDVGRSVRTTVGVGAGVGGSVAAAVVGVAVDEVEGAAVDGVDGEAADAIEGSAADAVGGVAPAEPLGPAVAAAPQAVPATMTAASM